MTKSEPSLSVYVFPNEVSSAVCNGKGFSLIEDGFADDPTFATKNTVVRHLQRNLVRSSGVLHCGYIFILVLSLIIACNAM